MLRQFILRAYMCNRRKVCQTESHQKMGQSHDESEWTRLLCLFYPLLFLCFHFQVAGQYHWSLLTFTSALLFLSLVHIVLSPHPDKSIYSKTTHGFNVYGVSLLSHWGSICMMDTFHQSRTAGKCKISPQNEWKLSIQCVVISKWTT